MTTLDLFEEFMDYLRHTDYKDYDWVTISKLSGKVRTAIKVAESGNRELKERVRDLETGNIRHAAI